MAQHQQRAGGAAATLPSAEHAMLAWHLKPQSLRPHPVWRAHANSRAEGHVGEDADGRRRAGLAKLHEPARAQGQPWVMQRPRHSRAQLPAQARTHLRALCGAVTPSACSRASRAWPVRVAAAHSASNRSSCLAHIVAAGEELHNPSGGCLQCASSQRRSEHVVVWCGLGSSGEPWLQLENHRAWWFAHTAQYVAACPTAGANRRLQHSSSHTCHGQATRLGPASGSHFGHRDALVNDQWSCSAAAAACTHQAGLGLLGRAEGTQRTMAMAISAEASADANCLLMPLQDAGRISILRLRACLFLCYPGGIMSDNPTQQVAVPQQTSCNRSCGR